MNAPTTFWPACRNSFHPAWFLVPVPALLQIGRATCFAGLELDPATVLQLLLGLLWIVPWVWWRSGAAPAWVVQWAKEIRGQMPGTLIALLGPSLSSFGGGAEGIGIYTLLIGCLIMAVGIFASEFENRTMSTLLTQPHSRLALYRRKLAVLAVLFLFTVTNALLAVASMTAQSFIGLSYLVAVVGLLVVVYASAPLFALLTRSTIAGATFTVAAPLILYTPLIYAQIWYYKGPDGYNRPPDDAWLLMTMVSGLVYSGICAMLGCRAFLRLEAAESVASAPVPMLLQLGRPAEWIARFVGYLHRPTNALVSLVRKELRLQSIPWIVALLMLVLALLVLGARWLGIFDRDGEVPTIALIFMGMAAVISLLGTGASCVAEERQIGTHDWQLTQPAALSRQWRVKLTTTLVVGLLMGCGWPLLLLRLSLGFEAFTALWPADSSWVIAAYPLAASALLLVSIFASSYSKSSLKAGVACIVSTLSLVYVVVSVTAAVDNWQPALTDFRVHFHFIDPGDRLPWVPTWTQGLVVVGAIALLFVVMGLVLVLEFARRNHRQSLVSSRTIVQQHFALVVLVIMGMMIPSWMIFDIKVRDEYRIVVERLTELIHRQIAGHRLPPEVYALAEVPLGTDPSKLAIGLLRERGRYAFNLVNPPISDPTMKRYRLVIPPGEPKQAVTE